MITSEIKIPAEFGDVCPFNDTEFATQMAQLVTEPMFKSVVEYAMPYLDFKTFAQQFLSLRTKDEFQRMVMKPFL